MTETPSTMPHIVVIDDDPDLRSLLADSLEAFGGFQVTAVADGALGLEAVVTLRPTCVIVDVMMPGLDGYQFVRAMRGDPSTRDIPIVILSALTQPQDQWRGVLSGADAYLFKPVPLEQLLAAVERAVATTDAQRLQQWRAFTDEPTDAEAATIAARRDAGLR